MNLMDLVAKITLDSSEYDKGLDGASGKAASFASKIGGGLKTAAKIGAAGVAVATTATIAFGKASVSAGMNFDSSMSQVAATMGTTVDQIQDLRDFAMDMGAKTAFSATQAADALNYMALAGYDAETSMNMLPNVLNLAAAGGMDLATASDMVTDASSALGLSLDETSELVDKMAKASSKSNTSVAQLGDAILTVGGTAKNLAGGTTELSTALGILGDNGIKGAEGGTALRNIILALSAPTDKAAKTMKELGLEAYDANGNLRPLEDIFLDLNNAMSDMTQGEQTEVLNEIFNKVDLKSANALLATSADRWNELSGAIDNANGAAQQMADTQLDNLAGDITLFKSALEGAQIVVSDQLTPSLREFVQFGTEGLTKITDGFKEGGISGAMEALGEVLSDGINIIIENLPKAVEAGMKLLESLGQGILNNLPVIIDAAVDIILMLAQGLISALPTILEAGLQIILQLALGIADALPELVPSIIDVMLTIVDTLTDPNTLGQLVDAAIEIIIALAEGLIEALPKLIEKAPEIIMNLVTALIENAPKLLAAALFLIVELCEGIVSNLVKIHEKGAEIVSKLIDGIKNMFTNLIGTGKEVIDTVKDGIKQKIEDAKTWGKDLISNFIDGIKQKWNDLKDSVKGLGQTIKDHIGFSEPKEGPLSNFHTYAPDMMELFAKGIRDNEDMVKAQLVKSFDFSDITTEVKPTGTFGGYIDMISNSIQSNQPSWRDILGNITLAMPIYIGGDKVDEQIIKAINAYNSMTGGR